MTTKKIVSITSLAIGVDATDNTLISNVYGFGDYPVATEGDAFATPVEVINLLQPNGFSHYPKHWVIKAIIDSGNYYALNTQQVKSGDATSRALRNGSTKNDPIGYLLATLKAEGAATVTKSYETGKTYLVDVDQKFTNREGQRSLTTLTFVCLGERTQTGV